MAENKEKLGLFFPTPIQVSEIAGAAQLNERLLAATEELMRTTANKVPDGWSCDLYTTIRTADQLHEHPGFRELTPHIYSEATKLVHALKLDVATYPLKITSCWINVYGKTHAQEVHNHANNVLSGVYYVQVPPGAPGIMFHSPMSDLMFRPPSRELNALNLMSFTHPARSGEMVLFRSFVRHSVPPNQVDGKRISIAFNVTM